MGDRTYQDGLCADGAHDACESTGSAIATLYPVRAQIREALAAWNPAWAEKARYSCEPPSLDNPCCGAGCHVCYDGDGSFDCYPDAYTCSNVDALGSGTSYVCGDSLSATLVPVQKCRGSEGDGDDPPCRALTKDAGWRQEQVCRAAEIDGVCPGLTTCCDPSRCSTNSVSLPTCRTAPEDTCESFTKAGESECTNALNNTCKWKMPKYGLCQAKPNIFALKYDCTERLTKQICKKTAKPKGVCKWRNRSSKCVNKCDTFMKKEKGCLKAKKRKKKLCTYDATAIVPGTGCTLK